MPPRIVSLLSSATEIVCALGCRDWLVGRSHECDYPADVAALPVCSEPTIDIHGTSREIDDRVKNSLRNALSIYRVHSHRLQELRPDVILTQTQCEVCAASLSDVEQAVCNLIDPPADCVCRTARSRGGLGFDPADRDGTRLGRAGGATHLAIGLPDG